MEETRYNHRPGKEENRFKNHPTYHCALFSLFQLLFCLLSLFPFNTLLLSFTCPIFLVVLAYYITIHFSFLSATTHLSVLLLAACGLLSRKSSPHKTAYSYHFIAYRLPHSLPSFLLCLLISFLPTHHLIGSPRSLPPFLLHLTPSHPTAPGQRHR